MTPHKYSKRERARRPPSPEFGFTFIVIGLGAGWLVALVVEVLTKPSMIISVLGGTAGLLLGGIFEAIRFWWRLRRRCRVAVKNRS
jgi:hypothetical protein